MDEQKQEELAGLHRAAVEAFVLRARRVAQHSLAADLKALLALAQGSMTLEFDHSTGKQFLTRPVPDEETTESAAARVRPILLNSEPVYWGKTLKALSFLGRGKPNFRDEAIRDLREVWKKVQPPAGKARAYYVQVQKEDAPEPTAATDNALGLAWFYGDVVHADLLRRAEGDAFGINERYRAAAMLVAIAMVSTIMTLNLIIKLRAEGILELSEDVFTEDVIVSNLQERQETEVFVGEAGTPLPDGPLGGIPQGFEAFHPDKI
jgi:hypothetical protein